MSRWGVLQNGRAVISSSPGSTVGMGLTNLNRVTGGGEGSESEEFCLRGKNFLFSIRIRSRSCQIKERKYIKSGKRRKGNKT